MVSLFVPFKPVQKLNYSRVTKEYPKAVQFSIIFIFLANAKRDVKKLLSLSLSLSSSLPLIYIYIYIHIQSFTQFLIKKNIYFCSFLRQYWYRHVKLEQFCNRKIWGIIKSKYDTRVILDRYLFTFSSIMLL